MSIPPRNKMKRELLNLKEGNVILIETSSDNALKTGIDSIKTMLSRKYTGIILSASRSCSNLLKLYKENRITQKKKLFCVLFAKIKV